ncbi:MAG: dihydrolipoyl dehydrogenase [Bdellovibrionaceae bacterium]|nr:dihydrolipoyl dehydrogenase [Pseudobdellovibrionaceae bacterium]
MQSFDIVVIGAGPGGYVAAIRAAQLGFKTAVIEREYLGGVCLNVGCIPSKAMITATHLLHKAQHNFKEMGLNIKGGIDVDMKQLAKWKQSVCDKMASGVGTLLKGNAVTVLRGEAEFKTSKEISVKASTGTETVQAKYFIVATGSRPIEIPGFKFDEKDIVSSTGALAFTEIPKRVVTIGGGYIGLEISSYLRKLGCEVIVVEAQNSLLAGVVDPECAQVVARKLEKSGVKVMYGAKAKAQKKANDSYEVTVEVNGKEEVLKADKILVTVGRRPNGDQTNLKAAGISTDDRGFIKVDAQRRTNVANIFAIGDIVGQPMLAHKASYEGVLVAEVIKGQNRVYDAKTVPAVVFTDPEIAAAGMTEAEAKAKGYTDLKIAKFPFAANGRAVSMMETDGFVKMIADAKTHVILGIHIVGPEASNLISEAALAIEMGARIEDIALTIHPHPTLGETMMEAAEATLGHAIHIIQKPLTGASKAAHL